VQHGPEPASLVLANHQAVAPSPHSGPPMQISSRGEYAAALEQPNSSKLAACWACFKIHKKNSTTDS